MFSHASPSRLLLVRHIFLRSLLIPFLPQFSRTLFGSLYCGSLKTSWSNQLWSSASPSTVSLLLKPQQIGDPVKDKAILDNNIKITMSDETCTPPLQISQINPESLREFLPEHASAAFVVLESHFRLNKIRRQIRKFHVLIEVIPPSLIVHFADIIQRPSSNPYDDLKAATLQHTQPSAAVMKLLAPGESFDIDFWKPFNFIKLSSHIQPILANTGKTKSIESLAKMAENIMENAGPPRVEEIPHTAHLTLHTTAKARRSNSGALIYLATGNHKVAVDSAYRKNEKSRQLSQPWCVKVALAA
ncbi:hypothetical protein ACTXT7_014445 [Hymenolepis weldensis]